MEGHDPPLQLLQHDISHQIKKYSSIPNGGSDICHNEHILGDSSDVISLMFFGCRVYTRTAGKKINKLDNRFK